MKKLIFAAFVIFTIQANAQFGFPYGNGLDSSSLLDQLTDIDTPTIKKIIEKPAPVPEVKDTMIERSELEVKRLNLQAQKLKLEQEIADLKNKSNPSEEEAELLSLKTENLKIIALKEKILLEKEYSELMKTTESKKYPNPAVYGQQFYRDESFKLIDNASDVVATENYIIGSGDVVQLEVWGYRYWSKSYTVTETGSIDISGYQKVFVKGLTLKQARAQIGSRLGLGDNQSSYSVNVTRPRTVSVTVLGEVFNPGTYTVTATNSAFNVLAAMGGPSNIGSVRNIYIKRDGKIRDSFDTYEYFNNVTHQREVFLQNNDYIIVMPAANQITVSGSVRRPGNYELKTGEGINDLIQFAGGTYPNTYMKDVVVTRYRNNAYEVVSVNLDSLRQKKKDFLLYGGESVSFKSVTSDNQFAVLVSGAVSVPGTYRVRQGMKISSLIKNANGLTTDAYLEKAYLVRTNKDFTKSYITFSPSDILSKKSPGSDIEIEDRDSIYIFRSTDIQKFNTVSVTGAVYKPLTTRYISGLTLGDLLFMSGGITEDGDDQKGFIIRTNTDFEKQLISFVPKEVLNKGNMHDFELLPKDEVTIYSKKEFLRIYNLTVKGKVKNPQVFEYSENTKVADLVNRAGGLEKTAFAKRALLIHEDLKTGVKTARTVNLQAALAEPESSANILLQRNDVLQVFDLSQLKTDFEVSIYGEVRSPGTFSFADNMNLQNLVDQAGGLEFIAAGTQIEIVRNLFLKDGTYQFLKPEVMVSQITNNLWLDSSLQNLYLQPFDKVFIRKNPNFIPLKLVYIDGAVLYPGYYALQGENEKLNSIFQRAGGFRPDAQISGINIERKGPNGQRINVVANSVKAYRHKRSHFNVIVKGGDSINVPFSENLVLISGDVNKETPNEIGAFYKRGKRAKYYVRNFGGGFNKTSDRRHVVVLHSNGARVGTHNYILFKVYPKVREGSKVIVKSKPDNNGIKSKIDMDLFISKVLARATGVLTLIGLYKVATTR